MGIAYYLVSWDCPDLRTLVLRESRSLRGTLILGVLPVRSEHWEFCLYSVRADSFLVFFCQQVDLERTFTFRNSKQTYSGIPVIVANMDTVGTFEMAVVMSQVRAHPLYYILFGRMGEWRCQVPGLSHSSLSLRVARRISSPLL